MYYFLESTDDVDIVSYHWVALKGPLQNEHVLQFEDGNNVRLNNIRVNLHLKAKLIVAIAKIVVILLYINIYIYLLSYIA